ncbi:DUF6692 family protein [Salinarimonas ramus]|uniref:DUF6692 domain-containing protein n=1 Tax=Salinarimonas ramus TaxID=690164 RepID=A0A917VA46_9HYPH|nr:DUF6692 family protein [Salinarimonas ramus]GGK54746.1 hypothetical protein GCM10011322_46910 [Salinarimonas ramus]
MRIIALATILALAACDSAPAPDDIVDPARAETVPRIVDAEAAVAGVHVPTVDPARMNADEVEQALGDEHLCVFRYTSEGAPVFATAFEPDGTPIRGVVKLGGDLVLLAAARGDTGAAYSLEAGPIRADIMPLADDDRRATATFAIGEALHAGYGGYHDCVE